MSRFKIGVALGFGLGYAVATGKAQELVGRLRGGGGAQSASERYFPPSTAGDAGVPPGGVSVTV